jgi:predicted ATPase
LVFHRPDFPEPKTDWIGAGGHRESFLKREADQGDKTAKVIRKLLAQCRVFHFHDTSASAKVRLKGDIEANRHLYPDGGNLAVIRSKCPHFDAWVTRLEMLWEGLP